MTTDTTREGFENWAVKEGYTVARDIGDPRFYADNDTGDAWFGYRAAKSDELAFLECLIGFHAPLDRHVAIEDRIAALKEGAA